MPSNVMKRPVWRCCVRVVFTEFPCHKNGPASYSKSLKIAMNRLRGCGVACIMISMDEQGKTPKSHLKKYFLTGLLVITPIWGTVLILKTLFLTVDSIL